MSKMRILQIAHDHPDWTSGGTEILAHRLTRDLDARDDFGARFLAAATSLQRPDVAPGALAAQGEDFVLRTGAYDRFSMTRLDGTDWVGSLARVLDATRPEIVHLHGLDRIGAEVLPALRRLAPRARIVLTLHDYQLICPNDGLMLTPRDGARCDLAGADRCHRCFPEISAARHALRRAHLMALLDLVDVFLAPSAFLRDRFVAWGLDPARVRLVPNAVPAMPLAGTAPRARPNRFAFLGNIARHKGVLTLLEAAARLTGDDLRVTLHGGLGWAEDSFRAEFATHLGAARPVAQHLGAYSRAEVAELIQRADWIVVPSIWWENAPLVILEAQAAGRPVITSGIGGMAELVADGINGLHVRPGDAAALAETMREVADQPELWARLAKAAPKRDYDAFVEAHVRLYAELRDRVPA
ncbi:glycosyltransferase family 4 protein [uncultured Amaricoccus sp.]|uniref:glycosyltransferase family 4 protein n=1 Tax=uncultured Amaricoccus sp. TaxID=339341 RepID=UPI00261DEBA9|nr:glycosyltransferase family 4 protein [uncultured Amaricoccus sp.]